MENKEFEKNQKAVFSLNGKLVEGRILSKAKDSDYYMVAFGNWFYKIHKNVLYHPKTPLTDETEGA